jgi:membrane fusion protein, heavy metal efflux system
MIVQRKLGLGRYVGSGASDPVFIIGDLSTVWVVADIRETEAPTGRIGQTIYFALLAYPERAFPANLSYVATALDPHDAAAASTRDRQQCCRTAQAGNVRSRA